MTTVHAPRVCNLRVAGGKMLKGGVRVDRTTRWGNPYRMRVQTTEERGRVVDLHARYLARRPELLAAAREELRGRHLYCWCAPLACHAENLLEAANPPAEYDFARAGHEVLCDQCKEPYLQHRLHLGIVDEEGRPWLHVLCGGLLVKL